MNKIEFSRSSTEQISARTSLARQLASVASVLVAFTYIFWLLWRHSSELKISLTELSLFGTAVFLLLATVSIAITTLYHAILLREITDNQLSRTRVCAAYAMGQIVRYLPGKVWGIFYEANTLRGQADVGSIILSILIQTLFGYAWAMALSTAILMSAYTRNAGLLLPLLPAALALWFAHRISWPLRGLTLIPLIGKHFRTKPIAKFDAAASRHMSALLVLNWIPFLAAWVFLLARSHSATESITYGAAYVIASIATTAFVVVPSGLIVREALFTWLGSAIGLPIADLLLYGAVVRVLLTAADLLNAGVFLAASWKNQHSRMDAESHAR